MERPNTWGSQYLWPFQAGGACCRSQAPDARKVSGSGFHLLGVYTPRRVGSQIFVLRFLHFLHASTQNSKDLEKRTNSCTLKAGKAIRGHKELPPCVSAVCPFKIFETLICARVEPRVEPINHPLLPQEQAGIRPGGRPYIRSPCWNRTSRIAFRLKRRPELFLSISEQPTTLYGIVASPKICCDCYLIDTWSAWPWRWLAIAVSPSPPEMANGAGYDALRTASDRDLSWRPFSSTSASLTSQPPSQESMHMLTT